MMERCFFTIAIVVLLQAQASSQISNQPSKIWLQHVTIDTTSVAPIWVDASSVDVIDTLQHYVVQFAAPLQTHLKDAVRDLVGHNLTRFIPDNAFVVYTTTDTIAKIQSMNGIVWTGLWQPEYKYVSSPGEQDEANPIFELMVVFGPLADINILVQDISARAFHSIGCTFTAQATEQNRLVLANLAINGNPITTNSQLNIVIEWLTSQSDVYFISRGAPIQMHNYWAKSIVQNNDPAGRADSDLLFAQHGIQGVNQIAGISDSGISKDSCFITDPQHNMTVTPVTMWQYQTVPPSQHRKVIQYIATDLVGDGVDRSGHGTHVAGTIAGKALSNKNGFSKYNGVAPEAKIAFFDMDTSTMRAPWSIDVNMYPYSYSLGARVHSNSWAQSSANRQYTYTSHDADTFIYKNPDMLLVFAAGNDGDGGVVPPSTAKNCLSVGASESSKEMLSTTYCSGPFYDFYGPNYCYWYTHSGDDKAQHLASFSGIGPTTDGRFKPDLVGPGDAIVSANTQCNGTALTDLAVKSGTSMATPVVAGHMLLIREYLIRGFLATGSANASAAIYPSAALLKAIAITGSFSLTTRERYDNTGGYHFAPIPLGEAPEPAQGFGRLQINRVLFFSNYTGPQKTIVPRGKNGSDPVIGQNETHEYCFRTTTVDSSYPPRFTLVWTDVPAQTVSAISLVQDLDLLVYYSNRTYYANGRNTTDSINNVERVQLPKNTTNRTLIKVQIVGKFLPVDPLQKYAFVATGAMIQVNCPSSLNKQNPSSPVSRSNSASIASVSRSWSHSNSSLRSSNSGSSSSSISPSAISNASKKISSLTSGSKSSPLSSVNNGSRVISVKTSGSKSSPLSSVNNGSQLISVKTSGSKSSAVLSSISNASQPSTATSTPVVIRRSTSWISNGQISTVSSSPSTLALNFTSWRISLAIHLSTFAITESSRIAMISTFIDDISRALNAPATRFGLVNFMDQTTSSTMLSFVILPNSTDPDSTALLNAFSQQIQMSDSQLRSGALLSHADRPPVAVVVVGVDIVNCGSNTYVISPNVCPTTTPVLASDSSLLSNPNYKIMAGFCLIISLLVIACCCLRGRTVKSQATSLATGPVQAHTGVSFGMTNNQERPSYFGAAEQNQAATEAQERPIGRLSRASGEKLDRESYGSGTIW